LWVEDEESIRIIVDEMVKILGHQVDVASSGKEALDLLSLNAYDLVVTDLGMPEMNGWQLADIIKEKFDNHMKVAIASGWGNQKSEVEKTAHGIKYNLDKPFGMAQLQKLLDEVAQLTLVE
jgi:CheY-like chemotaxis protein